MVRPGPSFVKAKEQDSLVPIRSGYSRISTVAKETLRLSFSAKDSCLRVGPLLGDFGEGQRDKESSASTGRTVHLVDNNLDKSSLDFFRDGVDFLGLEDLFLRELVFVVFSGKQSLEDAESVNRGIAVHVHVFQS